MFQAVGQNALADEAVAEVGSGRSRAAADAQDLLRRLAEFEPAPVLVEVPCLLERVREHRLERRVEGQPPLQLPPGPEEWVTDRVHLDSRRLESKRSIDID